MKKILYYTLFTASAWMFAACDTGFDDLNIDQTRATSIDPAFLLNNAMLGLRYNGIVYEIGIVQQIIAPFSGVLTGANYNQDNRQATDDLWQNHYRNVIRNTQDVIRVTKDVPERSNLYNMARILQAHTFMTLTDGYGDIPYFEGGKAYPDGIFFPKYDAQEAVYADIITELTQATAALDATGRVETADVLYAGNIDKWKKFGNSLLLRAGMRLSKVDPTKAQQTVQAAFQGGVITSLVDDAYIRCDANYTNPTGGTLNGSETNNYFLVEAFVDFLKNTGDPRLKSIAVRYIGAASGSQQQPGVNSNTDPAVQTGFPMGYDNNTIQPVATAAGLASFYEYSQVDRTRMAKLTSPFYIVTSAQNHLLLAEAAERGWIAGDVEALYNTGVTQHMLQMAVFDANSAVPAGDITAYLAANPFDAAGNALEQINTQYWVASFLNSTEAYANFRRSGFPDLDPNPYPGTEVPGAFIRRLTYPNSEISVNTENVNVAIARMGADDIATRVWWDKP
jgi:hypothetical protein